MESHGSRSYSLAEAITKAASKQTYYTIRFLVDRDLFNEAFLAYGYFRWVDDNLDSPAWTKSEKLSFISRQQDILNSCYRGIVPADTSIEEQMLVDLVKSDRGDHPGLRSYLKNMMAILEFDAYRQGELISQEELAFYSQGLATAVTDAMYYFIGHDDPAPVEESRYLAVIAAHVTHMLRDTFDDQQLGYFNIPREYLIQHKISPYDISSTKYRTWVCSRIQKARQDFKEGRRSLAKTRNLRCRIVGFAYSARFEWMLRTIERENFCLRARYDERKGFWASMWITWNTLSAIVMTRWAGGKSPHPYSATYPMKES